MDMEQLKKSTPLEVLVYWINERHDIYLRRQAGQPWPWTEDPILQKHKFACVFRELDKTTAWMRKNLTDPHIDDDPALMIFNCALFRMVGTIDYCQAIGGWQDHFDPDKLISIGEKMREEGKQVFTGAYIISGGSVGPGNKLRMVIEENIMEVWRKRKHLAAVAAATKRMSSVFKELLELPGYGGSGFMAYELVTDLRWTKVFGEEEPTDTMTWSNPGPGAMEGLNLIHNRPLNYRLRSDLMLEEMRELLIKLPELTNENVPVFELRDVEHCLCELSKYWRCLQGEGSTRSLYYNPEFGMPDPHQPKSRKHRGRPLKEEAVSTENKTGFWARVSMAWKVLMGTQSTPAPVRRHRGRPRKDEIAGVAPPSYAPPAGELQEQEPTAGQPETPPTEPTQETPQAPPPATAPRKRGRPAGSGKAVVQTRKTPLPAAPGAKRRGRPPGSKNKSKE